ncbi:MAG: M20 family metallo-hydrolase [Synergistaceae bacterium]|nr:M20 family metallo-hydrolase [Synergistaceae bacterium]
MKEKLFNTIELFKTDMIKTLSELISIPAINPIDGGLGEYRKAEYILEKLKQLGLDEVKVYNSEDSAAERGVRPNIIVKIKGKTKKRLWIISHVDVVPAGDLSLWMTDPFQAFFKDGKLYGRGSSDNGQEIVASLYSLLALLENKVTPQFEICLCFVASEEVGSEHGIRYLMKQNLFNKDDLIVVPDAGSSDGSFIQIAEKSTCWIEFEVIGEQVHASTPNLGNNSCRVANEFSVSLDMALHSAFPDMNSLFSPSISTFEPTRRITNVENINTVPGRELFCFDCRILPSINIDKISKVIDSEIKKFSDRTKTKIQYKFIQKEQAPAATSPDAPVVDLLQRSLLQVIPITPKIGGIGGGTCAAYLRKEGIPVVVWGQEDAVAHMPNEYSKIEHMLNETKVFALMMAGL